VYTFKKTKDPSVYVFIVSVSTPNNTKYVFHIGTTNKNNIVISFWLGKQYKKSPDIPRASLRRARPPGALTLTRCACAPRRRPIT